MIFQTLFVINFSKSFSQLLFEKFRRELQIESDNKTVFLKITFFVKLQTLGLKIASTKKLKLLKMSFLRRDLRNSLGVRHISIFLRSAP